MKLFIYTKYCDYKENANKGNDSRVTRKLL